MISESVGGGISKPTLPAVVEAVEEAESIVDPPIAVVVEAEAVTAAIAGVTMIGGCVAVAVTAESVGAGIIARKPLIEEDAVVDDEADASGDIGGGKVGSGACGSVR